MACINLLARQLVGSSVDPYPHASMVFLYLEKDRDPAFRNDEYVWVRNTLLALDGDDPDEVITDRSAVYFSGRPSTAGVLLPSGRMKFFHITPGMRSSGENPDPEVTQVRGGGVTMGMLAEVTNKMPDWTDKLLEDGNLQDGE